MGLNIFKGSMIPYIGSERVCPVTLRRSLAEQILTRMQTRKALAALNFWSYQLDMESVAAFQEQARALSNLAFILPWSSKELRKKRIGAPNDGGYVMASGWEQAKGAISIGVGTEDSWDWVMAEAGIPTFQFDHTIDKAPRTHPNLQWQPIGLGVKTVSADRVITLQEMMRYCPNEGDLLLQIDVEGAEWAGLANTELNRFSQIVIELHMMHSLGRSNRYQECERMLTSLTRNHRVIHVHPNNCCGLRMVAGLAIPPVIEVTLLREDLLENPFRVAAVSPTCIDQSNVQTRPELFWSNPADIADGAQANE